MGTTETRDVFGGVPSERERLSSLVTELIDVQQTMAQLEARETRILAEAEAIAQAQTERLGSRSAREREMPLRCIAAELAVAIHVNDRRMQAAMDDAATMTRLFPSTLDALGAGLISRRHADAIVDTGHRIPQDDARMAFEQVMLQRARTQTAARVRAFGRQLAERLDSRPLVERHAEAAQGRLVTVREVEDGMAELVALLPSAIAFGIRDRLTRQAKAIRAAHPERGAKAGTDAADRIENASDGAGDVAAAGNGTPGESDIRDERTLDQIRADVFADMLLTGSPAIDPTLDVEPGGLGAIRAHVSVTVPVTTLTDTTQGGAELEGRAPVDAETARRLAGGAAGWDRVMLHPVTGTVLAVDRYRPTEELKRTLRARDRHCRFPGCRMAARRCDIDHTHDAALGGATELGNLACFCRRHHTLKHATDWTVRQRGDGCLEWTSPTGRRCRDDPPVAVMFVPDADPAPF